MAMTNRNNNKHDCFIFSTLEQLVPQVLASGDFSYYSSGDFDQLSSV